MARYEYKDEKSSKFWEIELSGTTVTTRWGRIGTDGQSKTKEFDDDAAAQKEHDKLVASKTKKGYVEVEGGAAPAAAGDEAGPQAALRALLTPLCSTDADREILDALVASVQEVTEDTVTFEEWEFNYTAGGEVPYNESVPKSFSEIAQAVRMITWDGGGPEVGYAITAEGESEADGWLYDEVKHEDDFAEECAKIDAAGGPGDAFLAGQNGIFFDPTRKLANGEPALAFIDHAGGGWVPVESVDSLDYKQILLRMIADAMLETDHVPELSF